jgi:sec-independent protein translocase protein TatA
MFGPLGVPELLFILVLALLIFGPKRLPEVGRTLGRGMSEFRKASNELKRTVNAELALEEEPTPPPLRPYRVEPPAPSQSEEPRTETSQPRDPH